MVKRRLLFCFIDMSYYWTGWTWDPHFFPSPSDAIGYLKESGLHVGVNIHDETGVQSFEKVL